MRTIDCSKVAGVKYDDGDGKAFKIDHSISGSNSLRIIEFHSVDEIDNFMRDLRLLKRMVKEGFWAAQDFGK